MRDWGVRSVLEILVCKQDKIITTYNFSSHFLSTSALSTGGGVYFLFRCGGTVSNPILSNNWNCSLVRGLALESVSVPSPAAAAASPLSLRVTLRRIRCVSHHVARASSAVGGTLMLR